MRVLVGGVGYRNLRDYSIGVVVAEHLANHRWPSEVVAEDLSYNPIAVVQRLEDEPADDRFGRLVLVAGVSRPGRPWAGLVTAYRWNGQLPSPEEIQQAVSEAVTGIISLDNTLVIGRYFGAFPTEVVVVEVEPHVHEFGDSFSPTVAQVFPDVCDLVVRLATDNEAVRALPELALGGAAVAPVDE